MRSIRNIRPNILRGGQAIPIGNNFYYMQGRKHEQGGIDVGKDLEVEDGELMQITPKSLKVYSAQRFLGGKSPTELVLNGANPNKVFNAQEEYKDRYNLKDDGTKKKAKYGDKEDNQNEYTIKDQLSDLWTGIKGLYHYATTKDEDKIKSTANYMLQNIPKHRSKELIRTIMEQSGGGPKIYADRYGVASMYNMLTTYMDNVKGNKTTARYTGNTNPDGSVNINRNLVSLYLDGNEQGFENVTNNEKYKEGADYVKYIRENYPQFNGQIQTYKLSTDGVPLNLTQYDIDKGLNKITGAKQNGKGDNIQHHLRMIKQAEDGSYYAVDSDIWDFNPKDWNKQGWSGSQNEIIDSYGKPFILKGIRPINIIKEDKQNDKDFKIRYIKAMGGKLDGHHFTGKRIQSKTTDTVNADSNISPVKGKFGLIKSIGNFVKDNPEDIIGAGSNILGSVSSWLTNNIAINRMKAPTAPVSKIATKLKTRININPQLDKMRETVGAYERQVRQNTSSSATALNRINRTRFAGAMQTNQLYADKENKETELINQDRLNQQQVANANVDAYNQYSDRLVEHYNKKTEARAENVNALISGINSSVQNVLEKREKRAAHDKTNAALMAANPDLPAEHFYGLGLISKKQLDDYRKMYPLKKTK